MSTERKILANLAWRVYKARQLVTMLERYIETEREFLYHEAVAEMSALHNAFQAAKQIYFDSQPKD
jgi:hypothetical protein